MSTLWNSSNSVQKAVDLTNSTKNWRKMRIHNKSEFSDQKNWYPWPLELFEIGLQNHPDILWNGNVQIAAVGIRYQFSSIKLHNLGNSTLAIQITSMNIPRQPDSFLFGHSLFSIWGFQLSMTTAFFKEFWSVWYCNQYHDH